MLNKTIDNLSLDKKINKIYNKIKINCHDLGLYIYNGKCSLVYLNTKNLDNITCYEIDNSKKLDIIVKDKICKRFVTNIDGKEIPVEAINGLFYIYRSVFDKNYSYCTFADNKPISKDIKSNAFKALLFRMSSYYIAFHINEQTHADMQTIDDNKKKSFTIEKLLKYQDKLNDILEKQNLKDIEKNNTEKQNEENELTM